MTANPLKAQLEAVCQDLWWSSEADYPVEVLWHELSESQRSTCVESVGKDLDEPSADDKAIDDSLVRQIAGCEKDANVTSRPFDAFFTKYLEPKGWHTAEDKQQLKQLGQLKMLLSDTFSHPQVYRCGEVEITLCIGGYADGIFAGVKTCIVET